MKKILVTGGVGYIGSHTAIALAEAGYTPILIDNLAKASATIIANIRHFLQKDIPFYAVDCNDSQAIAQIFAQEATIEGVIHFAAYREVGESLRIPLAYYTNNINSLAVLINQMQKFHCPYLVFSSSCAVYGQASLMPVTEQTPMQRAESVYGNTKQINEEMIQDFAQSLAYINNPTDFQAVILRYFNPIASHPEAKLSMGYPNDLIRMMVSTAAKKRDALTVFGQDYPTADGTCIRDYLHVMDLAQAHVKALDFLCQKKQKQPVEIFNVGTGQGNSVLEMIQTFEQVNDIALPYIIGERRTGDVAEVYADVSKAAQILQWKAQFDLKTALKHSWQWQCRQTI